MRALRLIERTVSCEARWMNVLRIVAWSVLVLTGCSNGAGPLLPDLPPCPGPMCDCADPDDCTCMSRSECALTCGDACSFACREDSTCASAAGNGANLSCVEDTTCTLYAGDDSNVTCTAANCTVEVGDGSNVSCRDRGTCEVTCLGSCNVSCSGSTVCRRRCGTGGAPMEGSGTCP